MSWVRNLLKPSQTDQSLEDRISRDAPDVPSLSQQARDLIKQADRAQSEHDWSTAKQLWQLVAEHASRNVNAWLQLGNMENELGDYDAARVAFETARMIDPANADAMAGLAGVCERRHHWRDAARYWDHTISLISAATPNGDQRQERLSHAFRHAALAALNSADRQTATEFLLRGADAVPGFSADKAQLRLRSQLASDPVKAKALLGEYLTAFPKDRAGVFDYASMCLADESYADGIKALDPILHNDDLHHDFIWLAIDLNERLRRWAVCAALCESMLLTNSNEQRFYRRLFDFRARDRDLIDCRRVAGLFAACHKSLDLIHRLISLYEDNGEDHKARLTCRWLMRAWPHSQWHQQHYINLVASTLSLTQADRLTRDYIKKHGRDQQIEIIYCTNAFRSGNYMEAKRRLEHYVRSHPHDHDRQVLLGYVLANATGIDAAHEHFSDLAVQSYQAKGAITGLAHMAMRKRDVHATLERWKHVIGLYPDDTIARVELARAAYELRRYDFAREICVTQLDRMPDDVTMAEFYAWFLVATGKIEQAAVLIAALQKKNGASWSMLELAVQTSSQLGRLDADSAHLFDAMPTANSFADSKRFYHVVRQLCCALRPDLLHDALAHVNFRPRDIPWLFPYLEQSKARPAQPSFRFQTTALRESWAESRAWVRDDIVSFISNAPDEAIHQIVSKPKYEQPVIHVVNKFEQVSGGSELHALDVAAKVGAHAKVRLWAPEMPHPEFSQRFAVQAIEPGQGHVPHGGVIVLIGVYFDIASWIGASRPSRVIILYNTFEAPSLFRRIAEVYSKTGIRAELLYCSDMMGAEVGLPGFFEPSPIDIDLFKPVATPAPAGRFILGRHSRDVMEKHHPEDWRIYEAVAQAGGHSRLLGGTCMKEVFPHVDNIDYLPARSEGIAPFLQGLDCYLYRTSTWIEPWGRVVIEAMACGIPVIASRIGGYAQVIEHGVNGLLFDTTDEAVEQVQLLARDPTLRHKIGMAGRATVETLLGKTALDRIVSFYLAA